ncbi:MAG: type II toxin-antitoxin system RelE/ParE family toxin [bacterium]
MHKVLFTDRSKKDLKKLEISIQKRIVEKLNEFSTEPHQYSKKLQDSRIGNYRFRIGDYRVAFDIENDEIIILRIRHRKDIYR